VSPNPHDLPELLQGSFKIFDNLLCDDVGIGKVVGGFEGFVLEPENVEAGSFFKRPFRTQDRA